MKAGAQDARLGALEPLVERSEDTAKIAGDARARIAPTRNELPAEFADSFDLNDWIR